MAHHHNMWLILVPTGLSWGRPTSRLGYQMLFVRKRSANVATATRCWSRRRYHRTWCF